MSAKRNALGVGSALIALFSGLCAAMAIGNGISGAETLGTAIGLTGFFGGVTALSGWGALRGLREPKQLVESTEKIILQLAAASHGRITAADLACNSTLSLAECEEELRMLTGRQRAEAIVTESGVVVYQIRGLLSAPEKRDAVDLLDS